MVESRWLRWIGPGLAALGAVGLVAATTLGAGTRPWTPDACAGPGADLLATVSAPAPDALPGLRGEPWYRLDPLLDGDGALRGQRLTLGLGGDHSARILDLSNESFAAGPFGRLVVAGSDDGAASRLRAIDIGRGCAWSIATEGAVIRRATIDPTGRFAYEMRVDRATRADLGVWRRPLNASGSAPAQRVLEPIAADDRFGRTFSTEFTWDVTGDRLAVQSCGEAACRTRVITPDGREVGSLEMPDLGLLVGLDGDRAVTYASCRGLPCPIVSTDLWTGDRTVLAPAAGLAILVTTPGGVRLVHETGVGPGRGLRAVALDASASDDLGPLPDGLRLEPGPARADAATRLPAGWVILAPDGRLPADTTTDRPQLRHVPDGSTVPFDEAVR
ncbi:MAG: hypothetical protein ABI553_01955 [Chloroflexota bacterium]